MIFNLDPHNKPGSHWVSFFANFKTGKVYYFEELNCNDVDLSWDYERVIDNLNTISVMIYQELTTDIKGDPN